MSYCVALIPQYVLRRERLSSTQRGNTGLQTQGASNVLAGVLAGLLGQGYQSITAAVLGLHLVGLSAELYAGRYSERSLTATSLIDLLGEAYHQLEAK